MAPARQQQSSKGGGAPTLLLLVAFLAGGGTPLGTATAQKMEYSEAMRLQNPPEGLDKPGLKCSACVVACDAIRHELQQVPKWTELKIMEAFEKAVTLLGDQYGYSDAEGHACYVQVSSPSLPPPSLSACPYSARWHCTSVPPLVLLAVQLRPQRVLGREGRCPLQQG